MDPGEAINYEPKIGEYVGPYQLIKRLGSGGFASVWQGTDSSGESVAVKILHPRHCQRKKRKGPSIPERFIEEARMLASLNVPGVVRVLSIIDKRDIGMIAYTMELLDGTDLADCFFNLNGSTLLEIFAVVCETLHKLHQQGILHRDIKSANIFVSSPDQDNTRTIKLIDFGVAKVLQAKSLMESTATGVIVGTIQTLAPESIKRLSGENVELSWSVDQWGIGIALYHCLSSRLPFNNPSVLQLINDIQNKPTPDMVLRSTVSLDSIELDLEKIVHRCLAKYPKDRYPSMLAVAEALRGILSKCSQEEKNSAPPNRDLSQDSAVTIPPFETDKAPLSDRFTTTDPAVMDARSKSPNPQGINSESSELEEDHTKIDLFSESAETIMPGQLLRNQTKQESSDTAPEEKQANRAWSNPSIELAPVGHTRNDPGQAPTLQANQVPSSSQSFGVADTLPSAPKASENTALKEQKMAVPVESGLSLRLTLFILGISIIISFGMGWFLRGL